VKRNAGAGGGAFRACGGPLVPRLCIETRTSLRAGGPGTHRSQALCKVKQAGRRRQQQLRPFSPQRTPPPPSKSKAPTAPWHIAKGRHELAEGQVVSLAQRLCAVRDEGGQRWGQRLPDGFLALLQALHPAGGEEVTREGHARRKGREGERGRERRQGREGEARHTPAATGAKSRDANSRDANSRDAFPVPPPGVYGGGVGCDGGERKGNRAERDTEDVRTHTHTRTLSLSHTCADLPSRAGAMATHAQKVLRLYRHSLKTTLSWAVERSLYRSAPALRLPVSRPCTLAEGRKQRRREGCCS
jgi:hypothetical protein